MKKLIDFRGAISYGTTKGAVMGKIPAFSFERISDEVQEGGHSLQYQSDAADRYAERKGLSIVERFSVTESAYKHGERKEFNRMLTAATASGVKHFIFKSIDRYARNHYDGIKIFELIDQGAAFHFYEMGVVLDQTTEYQQRMFFWFMLANSEGHSAKLSQDITRSHRFKADKGIAPVAPLGYVYDHKTKRWVSDPEREESMRWFFDTFDNGRYSVRDFIAVVNERMRTPAGRPFTRSSIHQILKNPFYHGEFIFKGVVLPGTQDRYYEKPRFEERLRRLAGKYYPRSFAHGERAFAFRNVLCSCGCRAYGDVKKGVYTYYVHRCADADGRQISVREERIQAAVDDAMRSLAIDEGFKNFIENSIKLVIHKNRGKREGVLAAIDAKEKVLRRKQDRMLELYGDEQIDQDALRVKLADLKRQIEAMERERASEYRDDHAVQKNIIRLLSDIRFFPAAYLEPMSEERALKWLNGPCAVAARKVLNIEIGDATKKDLRTPGLLENLKELEREIIIDRTIENIEVNSAGGVSIAWRKPYSYFFLPEFAAMRERYQENEKAEPLLVPLCKVMLPLPDTTRNWLLNIVASALDYRPAFLNELCVDRK